MRTRSAYIAVVALVVAGLWTARPAEATPIATPRIPGNFADIKWTADSGGAVVSGLGTSDIVLDGVTATTLTLSIIQTMTAVDSLSALFGALAWDLDGGNELNGPGTLVVNMPPGGFFKQAVTGYDDPLIMPPTKDSLGATSGYALGIEQFNNSPPGPTNVTFTAFTVTFTVNNGNLMSDGNDIFWGAFGTGNVIATDAGGLGSHIYNASNTPWAGASVSVPEPGAVPLIALAAGALLLLGRSTRRGFTR